MKKWIRNALFSMVSLLAGALFPMSASGQYLGQVNPQTVSQSIFTAQSCNPTVSNLAVNITNLGQTQHLVFFTANGNPGSLIIRLEGSINGTTFFPISEDFASPFTISSAVFSGTIYANGFYPLVRVNLVECGTTGSITAFYSGASSTSTPPLGSYTPSQAMIKAVMVGQALNGNSTVSFTSPTNNSLGYFAISTQQGGSFAAGTLFQLRSTVGPALYAASTSFSPSTNGVQTFAVPAMPGSQLILSYSGAGGSAALFDVYYVFVPLGSSTGLSGPAIQPQSVPNTQQNSETVSAANTPVTVSITVASGAITRVHLFSVSARCSAGTAQLTVKDGVAGTTIWTSGPTEVSTTTFRFQWNPGLASTSGKGMDIVLGTCGAANTGTLDVQASQL